MADVLRATLSDLSHRPDAVLGGVEERDLLVTRRDKEDVVVSTVSRERVVRSTIAAMATALSRIGGEQAARVMGTVLEEVYPWTRSLPDAERSELATRYAALAAECAAHDDFQPLTAFVRQWQYTAEIHKDQRLLQIFSAPIEEDEVTGEPVEPPAAGLGALVLVGRPNIRVSAIRSALLDLDDIVDAKVMEVADRGKSVEIFAARKPGVRLSRGLVTRVREALAGKLGQPKDPGNPGTVRVQLLSQKDFRSRAG